MYKLIKDKLTNETSVVFNMEADCFIPFDPANTDYQEYIKWVAEGNTPEPADSE